MAFNFTQATAFDSMPSKRMKLSHIDTGSDSIGLAVNATCSRSTATPSPVYRKFSITSNTDSKSPVSATSLESNASSQQLSSVKPQTDSLVATAGGPTDTTMHDLTSTEDLVDTPDRLSTRRNRKLTAKAKELVGTKLFPAVVADERPSTAPSTRVVSGDSILTQDTALSAPANTTSDPNLVNDSIGTRGTNLDPMQAPAIGTTVKVDPLASNTSNNDVKKKSPIKLSLFIKPKNQIKASQSTTTKSLCEDGRSEKNLSVAPASAHGSFVTLHVNWRKFSRLARQKRPSMSVASLMAKQLQRPPKPITKPKKEPSADADTAQSAPKPAVRSAPTEKQPTKTNLSFRNRSASTVKPQANGSELDASLFCELKCLDPVERLLAWTMVAARKDLTDASDSNKRANSSLSAVHQALQSFCRCSASTTSKAKGCKAKPGPRKPNETQVEVSAPTSHPTDDADSNMEDAPGVDEDTIVVDVGAS